MSVEQPPISTKDAAARPVRPRETLGMTIDWIAQLKRDAALSAHD